MPSHEPRNREIDRLRQDLAGLVVVTKLIRLEQALGRKYSPDQPRAPAGQPDGGRWIGDGGGQLPADPADDGRGREPTVDPAIIGPARWASLASQDDPGPGKQSRERTLLKDGQDVLSIRVRSGPRAGDEEHTVTTPDGESRVFETSGDVQTIRDGATGEVLGRSTFTDAGPVAEAFVQSAFVPAVVAMLATAKTLELAAILFTVLAARQNGFGTVLGLTAQEYRPSTDSDREFATWIGRLNQERLEAACPRSAEIKAIGDRAAAEIRALHPNVSAQTFGDLVHKRAEQIIKDMRDPNLIAELSLDNDGERTPYGKDGSIRLNVYERNNNTVCVYDFKTGYASISAARAAKLVSRAYKTFIGITSVILMQVKPE